MKNAVTRTVARESGKLTSKERSEYFNFGFQYFGPFLYGFTKWLSGRLSEEGLTNVFFFSRDGYMMQKAFELLEPDFPKTKYVYFSRKSLRQSLGTRCPTMRRQSRSMTSSGTTSPANRKSSTIFWRATSTPSA